MRLTLFAAAAISTLAVTACNPVLRSHGYVPPTNQEQDIEVGDAQSTVVAQMGNPSTRAMFDENVWYYISSTREELAFLTPKTRSRSITAISFDETGAVTEIDEYDLEDGRQFALTSRETPTRGRELTILEQLFGNLGRLPVQQLPGQEQDLPGGAGGPRTDR